MKNNQGLSLIEILIAIVVSTVVMAAMFFTYNTFQNSYQGIMDRSVISQNARTALSIIANDIRMAGYKDFNSKWGDVSGNVINHSDKSNGPDTLEIIYDYNKDERVKIGYRLAKTNSADEHYYLEKARFIWTGAAWSTNSSLGGYNYEKVSDYIMDLQFVMRNASNNKVNSNQSNQAQTVETFIVVRSPNKISKVNTPKIFTSDNNKVTCKDNFHCEDFFVSIYPRNIVKN